MAHLRLRCGAAPCCIAILTLMLAAGAACLAQSSPPVLQGVTGLQRVRRIAGENSINQTDTRWNVAGTDLGHMFDDGEKLYMVFGDTFGRGFVAPPGAGPAPDWRSNVMAVITDRNPTDGLTFERMITDASGNARELIPAQRSMGEVTAIPTNGVAVPQGLVLHYMAVREWGAAGEWDLRHAGIAYSVDSGQNWQRVFWVWPSDTKFGQVAFVRRGGFVYLFGIPGGRNGGVSVARVPERDMAVRGSYRYYAGKADGEPVWSINESAAVLVVPAPVGELSVMWNAYLNRWTMTYLHGPDIVIREAPDLLGPWNAPKTVVSARQYPGLYSPYMHPWLIEGNGEIVYFTMSEWFTYGVSLMRVRLVKRPDALTVADIARALMLSGGLAESTTADMARLGGDADRIDLARASLLLREATGLH